MGIHNIDTRRLFRKYGSFPYIESKRELLAGVSPLRIIGSPSLPTALQSAYKKERRTRKVSQGLHPSANVAVCDQLD